MSDASDPYVFVRRSSGGGCNALMIVLAVFPVMGVGSFFADGSETAKIVGASIIWGLLGLALVVWQLIRDEHRLELQADRVRFVERQTWLGVARPETVLFEVPLDASSRVRQVNTRTPSSRGGWTHASHLIFPGDNRVTDDFLGSREDPKSEYNSLTKALKKRLGERFTVEDKV
jgi:hypothetical protein